MLAAAWNAFSDIFGGTTALMVRSLRVEQRLLRTYLIRLAFVLTLYIVLTMSHNMASAFSAPGLMFFWLIVRIDFIFITLAACSWFCTTITEEKEEMTLGLLLMAGVNPISIVLGKHVPRLISALMLLVSQMPFLLLAITLGGVTVRQILAAFIALASYLLMISSVGLLMSVLSPRSSSASSRMASLLFVYFLIPGFASAVIAGGVAQGWWSRADMLVWLVKPVADALVETNVWHVLSGTVSTGFSDPFFTTPVVVNFVAAAVFFGLAWLMFAPLTRNEKSATPGRGFLHMRLSPLRRWGTSRAWNFALAWKDFHFIAGGLLMLVFKVLFYTGMVALIIYLARRIDPTARFTREDAGNILMVVTGAAFFVELTAYASRIFLEEIKWRTLPMLVLLPKSIAEVAYGKVVGCGLALMPAMGLFVVGGVLSPDELGEFLNNTLSEPGFWYSLASYVFWLHVAVLLSLYVKWGALPLTFALFVVFQMIFMNLLMMSIRGDADPFFVFFSLAQFFVCFLLQVWIAIRLEVLAAQ